MRRQKRYLSKFEFKQGLRFLKERKGISWQEAYEEMQQFADWYSQGLEDYDPNTIRYSDEKIKEINLAKAKAKEEENKQKIAEFMSNPQIEDKLKELINILRNKCLGKQKFFLEHGFIGGGIELFCPVCRTLNSFQFGTKDIQFKFKCKLCGFSLIADLENQQKGGN